jgi:hypothetical protein
MLNCLAHGSPSVKHSEPYPIGEDVVRIVYHTVGAEWMKHLGEDGSFASPHVLSLITSEARLIIETKFPKRSRISALFTPQEVVAILGDAWPNERNMSFIRRSVTDRKAYPMPKPDTPQEKSFGAQGQTPKRGSHGESRHKKK